MYTVGNKVFKTFKEVEEWAWNTHKIELEDDINKLTEEQKIKACEELHDITMELEEECDS